MKRKQVQPQPMPAYPTINTRSGNKVAWATYALEEHANEVAKWAFVEANRKESLGYDFGYCQPGSITKVEGGFEVCLP